MVINTDTTAMIDERPNPIDFDLRALWAGVMMQAIDDLQKYHDNLGRATRWSRKVRRDDAESWFKSNAKCMNSFLSVCSILMLDPAKIRRRLFGHEGSTQGKA